MKRKLLFFHALIILHLGLTKTAQSLDLSTDTSNLPIKVRYMAFRPALWEEKALVEEINEKRNLGGLVFVYYTNTSDKPIQLREWYLNERENGHFRLAGDIAWDRRYTDVLAPGQTTVQEICGVSDDFQAGKKADFAILGSAWQPVTYQPGVFDTEKLRVTSITMDSTLANICIHIRSFVPYETTILSISFEGKNTKSLTLSAARIEGNGHVIARLELERAFTPGELALVKIDTEIKGRELAVYSHRNAYADHFPNGTWGIEENQYKDARRHHLNTMVKGGHSTDKFFSQDYKTTGIKAMPYTGIYPDIDMLRDLENHPAVVLWYIHDEPDWLFTPQLIMASHEMTKKYSKKKPTLITLCRNVKFFEFAFISDIPCQDHYTVTAPTTSKWPFEYGTRLEETGHYTADLKYASEPKPVWGWTQGLHLWEERPKMPLPTPDELGAQLFFNLGRGAKGNLWFTFLEEAGTRYPATKKALQEYSRLIMLLQHDLLQSDPWYGPKTAPAKIDLATLISPENIIAFVTNTDYQISDSAYQWKDAGKVQLNLRLPDWFRLADVFEINPADGIKSVDWSIVSNELRIRIPVLHVGKVLLITNNRKEKSMLASQFESLLKIENPK